MPLIVRDDVIGLLAVYPERGRRPSENEAALLAALAGQLAVAVQNAQLHEQATRARRASARRRSPPSVRRRGRLRALYEISRSFAQSLSLDETLDALARTVVEVLDVDAAVIRMPDERREQLVPRAIHVRDGSFADAVRTILSRPQPFGAAERAAAVPRRARLPARPGRGEQFLPALVPFLEKGWTAARRAGRACRPR